MTYDPNIGRWTTPDPIGFEGGDSNLYRYVFNEPVDLTDPSGEAAKRVWIVPMKGWQFGIDQGPEIFGGFEIHVYKSGQEVAKIKGNGGYCKTHGGKPLLSPSQFRKQYGDDAYKALKNEIKQRAKLAKGVGWAKVGGATVLLTFLIDGYAEAMNIAVDEDSAYPKVIGALCSGDMAMAEKYADEFYLQLLTKGAGSGTAIHWKNAWNGAVREALD